MIHPGEIYIAHLGPAGPRPSIVVSREPLNRGDYLVMVPCTSSGFPKRSQYAHNVPFRAGQFGFTKDSVAQCEIILSVPKVAVELDADPIGVLDDTTFRDLVRAVGDVIGSDCEPV